MKVIYAGTPEFAVPALAAIIEAGFEVVMVLTQPDRPAGRGMKLRASPVKELAQRHNLQVFQPETLKPQEVQDAIAAVRADVMVVAAYGLIIPTAVLNMPKLGCYNIHASLLPRWRGAAPIHRALEAGDQTTGVTIMEVVPALDAGAMISKAEVPITARDTTQTLHDQLAKDGARLMVEALVQLEEKGQLPAEEQDESLVNYAHKIQKAEAPIDWSKSAEQISRQIRAFNPFPVATAKFRDEVCKIWFATDQVNKVQQGEVQQGEIIGLENGIQVACGEGVVSIESLQLPGGKQLNAKDFVSGYAVKVGEKFS
jgi:methionyl-tRNA formyltransferase